MPGYRIMKNVYVTRRARFNAAHKLWNEDWDEAKNMEVLEPDIAARGCQLHHIRLYEPENNYADYYGGA